MIEIFGALVALGILVLIHEGGHFLVARLFKVKVEKFSIGFGPKLASFVKGDTEYRIAVIPLGGYVKMKGENPDEQNADEDSFSSKFWWQRALIAFAGPFANLIFGCLIFIFAFSIGNSYDDLYPIIGKVNTQEFSIFHQNDKIVSVNSQKIKGWSEIYTKIIDGKENDFEVLRDSQKIPLHLEKLNLEDFIENVLPKSSAVIGEVMVGLPAYQAGLMAGDEILEIDGKEKLFLSSYELVYLAEELGLNKEELMTLQR